MCLEGGRWEEGGGEEEGHGKARWGGKELGRGHVSHVTAFHVSSCRPCPRGRQGEVGAQRQAAPGWLGCGLCILQRKSGSKDSINIKINPFCREAHE